MVVSSETLVKIVDLLQKRGWNLRGEVNQKSSYIPASMPIRATWENPDGLPRHFGLRYHVGSKQAALEFTEMDII